MTISRTQKFILSLGAVSLVSLIIGWSLGRNDIQIERRSFFPTIKVNNKPPQDASNVDMTQFWNVWGVVNAKYLERDEIDQKKLIEGATAGLVTALDDPYSVYLNAEQNKESKDDLGGTFEGVGMQLGYDKEKNLVVIAPLPGTPAETAGIRAGDKIWMINDKDTIGMSIPVAVDNIKGPKGTKVKLKMQRSNESLFDVEITRDTIYVKSVEAKLLENDSIAHIKINKFGDSTKTEWDEAVRIVQSKNIKKIILDVRNNPGGYLDTAVYINSDFMTGVVLKQEDYLKQRQEYTGDHTPRLLGIQVVVLINKGSASASEIVAGAIQDRKIGKLIGETTFGKGTIQEVEDLSAGSGIHITTGKWLLPSGKWVHKEGLKPDFEVKITDEDFEAKRDPQLDKALELLK